MDVQLLKLNETKQIKVFQIIHQFIIWTVLSISSMASVLWTRFTSHLLFVFSKLGGLGLKSWIRPSDSKFDDEIESMIDLRLILTNFWFNDQNWWNPLKTLIKLIIFDELTLTLKTFSVNVEPLIVLIPALCW